MAGNKYKYLPDKLAEKLHSLELSIGKTIDGHYQGKHRSNSFGSSVEFAEYRDYAPGDPTERIDWPVFARSDKYVIRQNHEDVSLKCYLVLDQSASMSYRHSGTMTKHQYSCYLAAGLAYMLTRQGDSISLVTARNDSISITGPATNFTGLKPILEQLEQSEPTENHSLEQLFHKTAELIKGKAFVIVISDLLAEPSEIIKGLSHLHHSGKEVSVFHVLDPAELSLPDEYVNGNVTMANIECIETGAHLTLDMAGISEQYRKQVYNYLNEVRQGIMNVKGRYVLADTRREIYEVLLERSGG